ncbi:MAG: TlpA disulfide reductase family protein [Nitrospirota bacterium]
MRKIPSLFIFLFLTLFVRDAVSLDAAQIGKPAPEFTLINVNGGKGSLSEYKGKVVLLNFWATFCGPCKAEMPSLNSLFLSYQKDDFIVLAVSTDDSEKPVQSFIRKKAIAFPVLIDKDQEVYFEKYGVIGLPTSFLIDRDGLVREKFLGDRPWDAPEMKEKIEKLLSKNRKEGK